MDLILNACFIPILASSGAAAGTLAAEAVVLGVQLIALRDHIAGVFRALQYFKMVGALALAVLASVWTLELKVGNFVCLVISSGLFFGFYILSLILMRENLTLEIIRQISGRVFKKKVDRSIF